MENIPVEFEQAVAILEHFGYTVNVETRIEHGRYNGQETFHEEYIVRKDNQKVWATTPLLSKLYDNRRIRYDDVFAICFQGLDNQVKDQTLKTTLSKLDVGVF